MVFQEFKKLKKMQTYQPEYNVLRSYLECVADLPWDVYTDDNYSVNNVQQQLNKDHFGLDKVSPLQPRFDFSNLLA